MVTINVVWRQCGSVSRVLLMRARRAARVLVMTAVAVLMAAVLGMLHTQAAYANSSEVWNLDDTGLGSLRSAINFANSGGGGTITITVNGTIVLNSALPAIVSPVNIIGNNAITVSGNNIHAVLEVADSGTLRMQSITIANGRGGINTAGRVTVIDSAFISNSPYANW